MLSEGKPFDFFKLIVNDEIIIKLVEQTNLYALQKLSSITFSSQSRIYKWTNTSVEEMQNWMGLVLWMGLVQLPEIGLYWSKSPIFSTNFGKIMSRNRFQILSTMIHYSDNETSDKSNRLYKLGSIVEDVMINSNNCMRPKDILCIDESMIPFTGRLFFKQYLKNKRHKYGIKLFKLCMPPNYVVNMKVYAGKEALPEMSVSTKIVMELIDPYLDFGRTLIMDNWYTSVELAEQLGHRQTYCIGTLRSNRKSNPKIVIDYKLKKGQCYSLRSDTNVMVMKWKDKRDIYMCSTKSTNKLVDVVNKHKTSQKPESILLYNKGKGCIDLSDQKASFSNPLRRSMKWYRKVLIDVLLNTGVVNAACLFNIATTSSMNITHFRASLVETLIQKTTIVQSPSAQKHKLVKCNRSKCCSCYQKMKEEKGRTFAQSHSKKSKTKCILCDKVLCLQCFFNIHLITN